MVTRKPLPLSATVGPVAQEHTRTQGPRQQSDPDNIWGDETRPEGQQGVPVALRPGSATNYTELEEDNVWADANAENAEAKPASGLGRVPTVLKPGSGGVKSSDTAAGTGDGRDILRVPAVLKPGSGKAETNPFKRLMSSSSTVEDELKPGMVAPDMPVVPVQSFSQLSVSDTGRNPWQPSAEESKEAPPAVTPAPDQELGGSVWDSAKSSRQVTPGAQGGSPALLSLPSDAGSAGWEDEVSRKRAAPVVPAPNAGALEDAHAWDDAGNCDKGKAPERPPQVPQIGSIDTTDEWNLIDFEAPPGPPPPKKSEWDELIEGGKTSVTPEKRLQGQAPELPPRGSTEVPPAPPPRAVDKSETYQIKNITWHDMTAAENPRTSPILVQNANGPCPLVALVNALTLTTPADKTNTALVEGLRSREQVSLGFLLDAVFDELMSERRTNADIALPDVGELYEFLKGLHTGMNVNPRFIPTPEVMTAFKRTSLTHLHPTERGDLIPGTFEDTKEMALYATFSIPLIHGWLPSKEDAVYESFARQAASYEESQNLLFREEELEENLSNPHGAGLTEEEQQIYQDILTIKSFLSISATQLTQWGLEVIRKSMRPGSVAILFRNDHFSTLYKHPQMQDLLTLVTDAGYAGHAEVVWESLVDVNGERAEFFSGDFRLVGGASHTEHHHPRSGSYQDSTSHGVGDGWTTVQGRQGRSQRPQQRQSGSGDAPLSPGHEQEDRDLALALQLQEEEEERHRAAQERRRRESMLSEQFIEQQARFSPRGGSRGGAAPTRAGRGGRGGSQTSLASSGQSAPARRSSSGVNIPVPSSSPTGLRTRPATQQVRSLIPPRTSRPAEDGVDDAPPSYEQAAKQAPYVPLTGHPTYPLGAPASVGEVGLSNPAVPQPGPSSLANAPRRNTGPGAAVPAGRLRPGLPPAQVAGGKDRDCIVM